MPTRRSFLLHASMLAAALPAARLRAQAPPRAPRVFAAGPPAAILVYVVEPESLIGWPSRLADAALTMLGEPARRLPVVGRLAGRGSTVSLEALAGFAPDLVLDVGNVGPTYTSMAERVRSQVGVRFELLDGRLVHSATHLRQVGAWVGRTERADQLARHAERLIADVVAGAAERRSTRIYLGRGADGLETGLGGSVNVEVLEFVGARNVAAVAGTGSLTRVSLEQLLGWDPDIVLTQDDAFARVVATDPVWRTLRAVRERRVWRAPNVPFGWLDGPPGVNRLIGALWLARRIDGASPAAIRDEVRAFYDAFYRVSLSPADADRLLAHDA